MDLLRGAPGGDLLALVVHHLAVDVVSWGILLADLAAQAGLDEPALTRAYWQHRDAHDRGSDADTYWRAVLAAAGAVDDIGIDQVAFYRRDNGGDVLLYAMGPSARYELQTAIPLGTAPGSAVRYFARATDVAGLRADSAVVSVQVLP